MQSLRPDAVLLLMEGARQRDVCRRRPVHVSVSRSCIRICLQAAALCVLLQRAVGGDGGAPAPAPAFSTLLPAEGNGPERRWLCSVGRGLGSVGGTLLSESLLITNLRDRKGGGQLQERGKQENNVARARRHRRAGRPALLNAYASAFSDEDGAYSRGSSEGRDSGSSGTSSSRSRQREAAGANEANTRQRWAARRTAADHTHMRPAPAPPAQKAHVAHAEERQKQGGNNRISGGEDTASDAQIRALMLMLEEEENLKDRRNIILTLQHVAPQNHPLVVDTLCALLCNYKVTRFPLVLSFSLSCVCMPSHYIAVSSSCLFHIGALPHTQMDANL